MGFDIKTVTDCFKLTKKQLLKLLITIILPVAAGVAFIAAIWPSLITDTRTLNICLLGFVAALPVALINNIVWSLLFFAFLEEVVRIVATSFLLSSPGLKKNELARRHVRTFLDETFDEIPFFDDMRIEAMSSFHSRDIASVLTATAFYVTAILICLFKPPIIVGALLFLVIALLPPIGAMVVIDKVSSELQSGLSKMTHREIIDEVRQFVLRHLSPDSVKRLESGLYILLNGDRNTSLSEILESRMEITDSIWAQTEETQG